MGTPKYKPVVVIPGYQRFYMEDFRISDLQSLSESPPVDRTLVKKVIAITDSLPPFEPREYVDLPIAVN